MTRADLEFKSASLELARAAWQARLVPVIEARVSDARAHAGRALTDALRNTEDGRASILRINASPSYAAALRRLDELWAWLAGSSEVSRKGKVRDAREDFYRQAASLHFPLIPPSLRIRTDPEPTAAQVRHARAAAVHGYDPRQELAGPIATAKRRLKAAIEVAGRRGAGAAAGADALDQWQAQTANAITRTVIGLLNDSVEHADTEAGRDLIDPKFLEGVA